MKKTVLCVVRAGASGIQHTWLSQVARHVDIALSVYGSSAVTSESATFQHHFDGSKLGGVQDFFLKHPDVLDGRYTHVWLVEDDLYIPERTSWVVSRFADLNVFPLFAPTISQDSNFNHRITIQNSSFLLRVVDFVEQMNPVFSLQLFKKCLPHFGENFTGFGQEWLWSRYVNQAGGWSANLDCACVFHTRKGGQGTLYKASPVNVNARQEAELFMARHNLTKSRTNIAAILMSSAKLEVVSGTNLIEGGVSGYRTLACIDPRSYGQLLQEFAENTHSADVAASSKVRMLLQDETVSSKLLTLIGLLR